MAAKVMVLATATIPVDMETRSMPRLRRVNHTSNTKPAGIGMTGRTHQGVEEVSIGGEITTRLFPSRVKFMLTIVNESTGSPFETHCMRESRSEISEIRPPLGVPGTSTLDCRKMHCYPALSQFLLDNMLQTPPVACNCAHHLTPRCRSRSSKTQNFTGCCRNPHMQYNIDAPRGVSPLFGAGFQRRPTNAIRHRLCCAKVDVQPTHK